MHIRRGSDGRLAREKKDLAVLHTLVRTDPQLAETLVDVSASLQQFGGWGVHFTACWRDSGADVIIKLGLSEHQLDWVRLVAQTAPTLQPHLYATGQTLAGADIRWIAYEHLPMTLNQLWRGREFDLLIDAGVRFHEAMRVHADLANELTAAQLRERLERGAAEDAPGPVGDVLERFDDDWAWMRETCEQELCHGDLHLANVLMPVPAPEEAPARVIDPEPVQMPWALEIAYPQVLCSDPERSGWSNLVQRMGIRKRNLGRCDLEYRDLALLQRIALAWMAIRQWGIMPTPNPSWRAPEVWRSWNAHYIDQGAAAARSY